MNLALHALTGSLILFFTLLSPAQTVDPLYELRIEDAFANSGTVVNTRVLLDFPRGQAISGVSMTVCHGLGALTLLDEPSLGVDIQAVAGGTGPGFLQWGLLPTAFTMGSIISFSGSSSLPPQVAAELVVVEYSVASNSAGLADVVFCSAGVPAVENLLGGQDGASINPTLRSGVITISDNPDFVRGDVDGNLLFNGLNDALFLLSYSFLEGPDLPCVEAADGDGDGTVNGLQDSLYLLSARFFSGAPPPPPFPVCGGLVQPYDCAESPCP